MDTWGQYGQQGSDILVGLEKEIWPIQSAHNNQLNLGDSI